MAPVDKFDKGFSLFEFSIIMFLMVLMLGFSIPRFTQLFESVLRQETLKLAQLLTQLRTQAIIKGERYRIVFDTVKNEYSITVESPNSTDTFIKHPNYDKPIPLQNPVSFYNVKRTETGDENETRQFTFESFDFEKIIGNQYSFTIDSSGFMDTFDVKLRDKEAYLTLSVVNIMGDIEIGEEKAI